MALHSTLAGALRRRCAEAASQPLYTELGDDLGVRRVLGGDALWRESSVLARRLTAAVPIGAPVVLLFPPGIDFVCAFWACVLAGRVAVPVPSLDVARLKNAAPRLLGIVEDSRAALVLTSTESAERWSSLPTLSNVAVLAYASGGDLAPDVGFESSAPEDPDATVYLQYTSGSTAAARGVVIDATNVLAQCRAIAEVNGIARGSRILSWLPHHHDYGLVLGVLLPVCSGAVAWLMSPMSFLRRPLRWLEAIGRYGITHTGAPNFAYAACVRACRGQPEWQGDLHSLVSSSCGAEPIDPRTMAEFVDAFRRHGLAPGALTPAYGMAEAVLAITAMPLGRGVSVRENVRGLAGAVSCGRALPGMTVRIVDPVTRIARAEGDEGEIWVAGESVGRGYWADADSTAATFEAFDALGHGPYLRTGDLGVMLDGELYVTGRLKDLVIVRGRNLHPQDVEWAAQAVDANLRRGYGAAFGIAGGDGETVVLVQEIERGVDDAAPLITAIRRAVAEHLDLPLSTVVLVRTGSLPRTSSGKIRRAACREDYLAGRLAVWHVDAGTASTIAGDEAPREGMESVLAALWCELLDRPRVGRRDGFIALGGDSLRATQLASRLREQTGRSVGVDWVLAQVDLAGMADGLSSAAATPGPIRALAADAPIARVVSRGDAPTSYSQRRMWMVQQLAPQTTAYNMAFAFRIRGALDADRFANAIDAVARRHEAFRTTLTRVGDDVRQCVAEPGPTPLAFEDFSALEPARRETAAREWIEARIRRPFDLAVPPLHHAHLARLADESHVFLWSIHHAIGDLWTFGILLRELSAAYDDVDAFRARPPASLDYVDFAHWQRAPEREAAIAPQVERWCERLRHVTPVLLPADRRRRGAPAGQGGRVTAVLPAAIRVDLKRLCASSGVTPFMALLAVFNVLLQRCTGQTDLAVATPIANRHRLDIEGLVGTFVNTVVMRNDLSGNPSFDALLQRVRGVALAAYADQDAPFEVLVGRIAPEREAEKLPLANVMFNLVSVPFEALTLGGRRIEAFDFDRGGAQFDLALSVDLDVFGQVHLEYADDLFERPRAAAMLDAYLRLLGQALASPGLPVDAFDAAAGLPADASGAEESSLSKEDVVNPTSTAATGEPDAQGVMVEVRVMGLARALLPDADLDYTFFDAGGHSLLALRFAAQVEAELGVRLSLLSMSNTSLRGLAAEVHAARNRP